MYGLVSTELYHSSGPWKEHKYTKKVGKRYYYGKSYDDLNEVEKITADMGELSEKAKRLDEIAAQKEANGEDGSQYREEAAKFRAEIERLNGEREKEAKKLKKEDNSPSKQWQELKNMEMLEIPKRIDLRTGYRHKLKHSGLVSDELYHHGILGMKWGVRRYQNEDGSLTDAGRKRYGNGGGVITSIKRKWKTAKANKKRKATLEAKKRAEEDAQKHEAAKQEAIRSGNATQISKYQNELSNQELREALDRLSSKQRLSDMAAKEAPKKVTKLDKATNIANKAAQAADIAEKGIKAYNTFAKITNTFADDDSQLPIIGEKKEKRNLSKEEAIKSGDPKILAAWKGKLSKDEVVQAYTIANNWKKIADMDLKPEQKAVLEEAGKAVIDNIASQSSSDKSGSKTESKPVSALDAYEKAYDQSKSYKSFEKEMKPKDDKKEKTSIFKPKEPEKYEYKPSTYDPNERQSALWRSSFNPAESKKQDREAQQKRVEDLISKYSTSAGSDWINYQSEQAYKKAKDESHLTAKQIINNILEDEERKRKS